MIDENLHASLFRFCHDIRDELADQNIFVTVIDWDAHADINKLPAADVLGIAGYSFELDDHQISIGASFGISTWQDVSLFRHRRIRALVVERLLPTALIPVYDADSGEEKGQLVVRNGTSVMPMARTEVRPLQFVTASFLTDQFVES